MNTTIRTVANDLLTSFRQTNPEKKITLAQAVFWVSHIANLLKGQHIKKSTSRRYLNVFPAVPIVSASSSSKNIVAGRKYVSLPAGIFDFNNDSGIDYVSYPQESDVAGRPGFTFGTFARTTLPESKRLYLNIHEKPSLAQPYFYVVNSNVYFLGLETYMGNTLEMGLFTTMDPLSTINIDAPFEFPDELVPILIRQVYDLGRFAMLIPKDFDNDSIPDIPGDGIAGQRMVSVNDPLIQSPE